jgi:hypothetical protein
LNYIFRAVLILLIFSFIVYVLKAIARLSFNVRKTVRDVRAMRDGINTASGARSKKKAISTEMVRCAACGAFVAADEAVTLSSRHRAAMFCSRDCIEAHIKSA